MLKKRIPFRHQTMLRWKQDAQSQRFYRMARLESSHLLKPLSWPNDLSADYFDEDMGKIVVDTPLVGGAYGGKAAVQLKSLPI